MKKVVKISDSAAQIATAIEEQSVVTEQVSQNVVRINELTVNCESSSLEATELSSKLLDRISEQQSLILQFKC